MGGGGGGEQTADFPEQVQWNRKKVAEKARRLWSGGRPEGRPERDDVRTFQVPRPTVGILAPFLSTVIADMLELQSRE